jgi:hypothetical protein
VDLELLIWINSSGATFVQGSLDWLAEEALAAQAAGRCTDR